MQDQLSFASDEPGPRAELADPTRTVKFMLAGNAHVTFQSRKTSTRFTYRVQSAHGEGAFRASGVSHFVSLLVGPDNAHNYEYLGCVYRGVVYAHGRKSKIAVDAPGAVAFAWVWRKLSGGEMHPELAVYHEGRCGRCGRRLTTPRSIELGLGPTCEGKQS
jgi:hypothetical protein